jgi:hypothetical protein
MVLPPNDKVVVIFDLCEACPKPDEVPLGLEGLWGFRLGGSSAMVPMSALAAAPVLMIPVIS